VIERIQNKPENTERNVILQCKKQKSVTKKLLCVLASVFGQRLEQLDNFPPLFVEDLRCKRRVEVQLVHEQVSQAAKASDRLSFITLV